MPEPACGCGCVNTFDARQAQADLERYRRQGPDRTTRALVDAIVATGVDGARVLDIGGGIGAIQVELLRAGAAAAEGIDASPAYLEVALGEAARAGFEDRMSGRVGDFAAVAADIAPADVVTLDRVICCYGDVTALMSETAGHARRVVGLVHPRDAWWIRALGRAVNVGERLFRRQQRWYIHRQDEIDRPLVSAGFAARPVLRTLIWRVALYVREPADGAGG